MNQWLNSRYMQLLTLIAALMLVLFIRLFVLTIAEKEEWSQAAENLSTKTIYETAPRGQILDRNGEVLAGNAYTMSVRISKGSMTDEKLNASILKLTRLLNRNGDSLSGSIPIQMDEKRRPVYEKNADRNEFLKQFGLDEDLSAKEAFSDLRDYFAIQEEVSDEEARDIMVVRSQMAELGYKKYMPVTVAKDVSDQTVAILEESGSEYPGAEVFSEVSRVYPNKNTASHILGYLGKISDKEKDDYGAKNGYQSWDLVGKDGIEKAYEEVLRGKAGKETIQVNAAGNFVKSLGKTEAQKGRDVMLTIDLRLQKAAETALEKGLSAMRAGSGFTGEFGSYTMEPAKNAQVGAVVALDVKTGDVLAMASLPDFDPNLFASGISNEDWESLQSENPRDPLSPAPLYNTAAMSAVQPGSIFKMVTATAAMECGLDPKRRLYDDGYVQIGNKSFGCVAWNRSHKKHGYLNLQEALEVSCNYYFFDAATGHDFYTGTSLGYEKPIRIETIMDYARQYGLGEATGIEIPETVTSTPSRETKIRSLRASLENTLLAQAETYFERGVTRDRQLLDEKVGEICGWVGQTLSRSQVEEKLRQLSAVREERIWELTDLCKYTYLDQATWNTSDALNIAIGQGMNSYTPLQMAGYVATIGNKGVRNPLSLVEKIEGRGKIEKDALSKVEVSDEACFDELIGGMVKAANGESGSLRGVFGDFPVTVAAKSGTAQRSGKINPPDEEEYIREHLNAIAPNLSWEEIQAEKDRLMEEYPDIYTSRHTAVRRAVMNLSQETVTAETLDQFKESYDNFAWVVSMAPAEEPEIAVAVMIAQGGAAANAAPIAKEVMGTYFQQQETNE